MVKSSSRARSALGARVNAHLRSGRAAGNPAASADATTSADAQGADEQPTGDGMRSADTDLLADPPTPAADVPPAAVSPLAAAAPPAAVLAPTTVIPPAAVLGAPPAERFTPDGLPKLARRPEGSILGGVCGGIADHLRVPVLWVRVTFALLAVMAGAGVLAYALLWIFVPQRTPSPEQAAGPASAIERRQALGVAAVGVALLIVATALGFGQVLTWVLGPLGLAAIGAAFIWREADEGRRARWRRTAAGIVGPTTGSWWRLIGGCLVVVGGL